MSKKYRIVKVGEFYAPQYKKIIGRWWFFPNGEKSINIEFFVTIDDTLNWLKDNNVSRKNILNEIKLFENNKKYCYIDKLAERKEKLKKAIK